MSIAKQALVLLTLSADSDADMIGVWVGAGADPNAHDYDKVRPSCALVVVTRSWCRGGGAVVLARW